MSRLAVGVVFVAAMVIAGLSFPGCEKDGVWLGKDVLALVDGTPITVEEYRSVNNGLVPEKPEDRRMLLDSLVGNRLASRAAVADGILADPRVSSELQKFYAERLPYYLRKKLAEQMEVTDEELLERRKAMDLTAILNVKMLVTEKLGDAKEALAELEEGADFEDVAGKSSFLKSADRTVSLSDDLYPAGVRAALNNLKPGGLSPVMKMEMGYVVFRLVSRTEPEELWEQRKEGLSREIRDRKVDEKLEDTIDRLRSSADLKLDKVVLPNGEEQYAGAWLNGVRIDLDPSIFELSSDPHGSPHAKMNEETVNRALNNIINNLLLSEEARRMGAHNDPEFQVELGLNKDKIINDIYVDKVAGGNEATDEEVREYYEQNKDELASQELVRVSRILLEDSKTAEKVVGELKAGGDFGKLVKEYSKDDVSAAKRGDVGWVQVSRLKEPLREALYNLNVGEFSGVLKSDYGFEVLMATERKPSVVPEFADVEDTIRKRIVLKKRTDKVNAFYSRLYKEADIKLNIELLRSL